MTEKTVEEIKSYVKRNILIAEGNYQMACIRYDNVGNKEDGYDINNAEGELSAYTGMWEFLTNETWQETEEQKNIVHVCQKMFDDDIDYFGWDDYQEYLSKVD
jgi:hypothetical protein